MKTSLFSPHDRFVLGCRCEGEPLAVWMQIERTSVSRDASALRRLCTLLNLIVGHTPDGLNRRRHDRLAIVLEFHTEPQVDAVQFEEAPSERAAGDSD